MTNSRKAALAVVFLAAASSLVATCALAQSSRLADVIKTVAWAAVIEKGCGKLHIDGARLARMLSSVGLQPEDIEPAGRHGQLHSAFVEEAIARAKNTSPSAFCTTGASLFGPDGRMAPNLLVPAR